MAYLGNRINDAVCVELLKIFDKPVFVNWGSEDDEAYDKGKKVILVLSLLSGNQDYIPASILEKCIEYVDRIKDAPNKVKWHLCTWFGISTGQTDSLDARRDRHLEELKQYLCGLREHKHINNFSLSDEEKEERRKGGYYDVILPDKKSSSLGLKRFCFGEGKEKP